MEKGEIFIRLVLQTRKNQGLFGKELINPLPGDKILDRSKLKQIADDI